MRFGRLHHEPIILVPNSDTSGSASQAVDSQSQQLSVHSSQQHDRSQAQTQSGPAERQMPPQHVTQSDTESIALLYPGSQSPIQASHPSQVNPDHAFLVQSQPQSQLSQPVQILFNEKKEDIILVRASQSQSQTQSDSAVTSGSQLPARAAVETDLLESQTHSENVEAHSQSEARLDKVPVGVVNKVFSSQTESDNSNPVSQHETVVSLQPQVIPSSSKRRSSAHVTPTKKGKGKASPLLEKTNSPAVGRQQSATRMYLPTFY